MKYEWNMTEWINKMLSQRIIRLEADATKQALVAKGCSQESVLSSLLLNLVAIELITRNNNRHCTIRG